MAEVNATTEQKVAFGEMLLSALTAAGLRPPDLVEVIGAADRPAASSVVHKWITGISEPSRPKVLAIEEFLDLEPGTLSRHLGWLPIGAPAIADPEAAVIADARFTGEQKRVMLQLMKSFRNE